MIATSHARYARDKEVDDQLIRIVGRKEALERAGLGAGVPAPAVRSFVLNWRGSVDETGYRGVIVGVM